MATPAARAAATAAATAAGLGSAVAAAATALAGAASVAATAAVATAAAALADHSRGAVAPSAAVLPAAIDLLRTWDVHGYSQRCSKARNAGGGAVNRRSEGSGRHGDTCTNHATKWGGEAAAHQERRQIDVVVGHGYGGDEEGTCGGRGVHNDRLRAHHAMVSSRELRGLQRRLRRAGAR